MINLVIISNAPLVKNESYWYAYSPFINEIAIWEKHVDSITFCCPIWDDKNDLLVAEVPFKINKIVNLKEFNSLNFINSIRAIPIIFKSFLTLFVAMKSANHIHLRCPGNIGLLACIVQIFFPNKTKTAKYAGNWDPKANQPISYKLQKWILSNTFLTKNMQVLVYGDWNNQSKNIKSFFTATYKESDKQDVVIRNFDNQINFMFVGMLTAGKDPLYAIQLIENLLAKFANINLVIYGEGEERKSLENYIKLNNLENYITLQGNQNLETLKKAYQNSHFMILPSKSEGWPKAVAEAMFWGCLPIATPVSCVANMLDNGQRGILITKNLQSDVCEIETILNNCNDYQKKVSNAVTWSRKYTLDLFEKEIKKLLQG